MGKIKGNSSPLINSKGSSAALPDGLRHKAQGTRIRENKESIRFFPAPCAFGKDLRRDHRCIIG
jgi:hypothetical protein